MSAPLTTADVQDITIRVAELGDQRICRMLLPQTIDSDLHVSYAVAESREFGKIIAAVAWAWAPGNSVDVWRVATHVILPFRNRGIETGMLDFVGDLARSRNINHLDHWTWVDADSETEQAQLALGFRRHLTIFEFECVPAEVYQTLSPLLRKVRERGRIPTNAKIVGLAEADSLAVAKLHVSQLGGAIADMLPMLEGRSERSYDPYFSTVLYVGGKVMGCNLFRRMGDDWGVEDASVIHPSLRNGWAMLWLGCEHARRGIEQGIARFRFTTFKRENGDRLIGARVPIKLLTQRAWLRMSLEPDHASAGTR